MVKATATLDDLREKLIQMARAKAEEKKSEEKQQKVTLRGLGGV